MNRVLMVAILIFVMVSGIWVSKDAGAEETMRTLSDLDSAPWAKSGILAAVEKGYVSGYPDGTFQPNKNVNRAEFIKMIVDALKLPHSQDGTPWFQPYVAAALEGRLHVESDFTTYKEELTRMEMVRLALRAADTALLGSTVSDKEFMYEATTRGVIHGMEYGMLEPEGTSTRAQAVAVIERILKLREGATLPTDKRAITYAEVDLKGTNIESALDGKYKLIGELPIKFNAGRLVDAEVDQIIVLDYEDKESAYMQYMKGYEFADLIKKGMLDDDSYVIAMHMNLESLSFGDEKRVIWNPMLNFGRFTKGDDYGEAFVWDGSKDHYFQMPPAIALNQTEFSKGWWLLYTKKENVRDGSFQGLRLYLDNEREYFFFTK